MKAVEIRNNVESKAIIEHFFNPTTNPILCRAIADCSNAMNANRYQQWAVQGNGSGHSDPCVKTVVIFYDTTPLMVFQTKMEDQIMVNRLSGQAKPIYHISGLWWKDEMNPNDFFLEVVQSMKMAILFDDGPAVLDTLDSFYSDIKDIFSEITDELNQSFDVCRKSNSDFQFWIAYPTHDLIKQNTYEILAEDAQLLTAFSAASLLGEDALHPDFYRLTNTGTEKCTAWNIHAPQNTYAGSSWQPMYPCVEWEDFTMGVLPNDID
jgi:hypothetical protein